MRETYRLLQRCPVCKCDVQLTLLVAAEGGGSCQIEMTETPTACSHSEGCPRSAGCLLDGPVRKNGLSMKEDSES